MKKLCVLLLSVVLSISLLGMSSDVIEVFIDGQEVEFDVVPEIKNQRTMVPLKLIFDKLEMTVEWDGILRKVTASKEGLTIELTIDSSIAYVNDTMVMLDSPAYIKDSRTMVPLAFVAEATGAVVTWNDSTRDVYISSLTYPLVDTGLERLFTDVSKVSWLSEDSSFYGQDGHYEGNQPSYIDNGDGTVLDTVTGLMWQQTMDEKMSFDQALIYANESKLGGYSDWRLPSIKELFSLILFTGMSGGEVAKELYIDTDYFDQPLGDTSIGERDIDAQTWSGTEYVGKTMQNDDTAFGVNFIDGRIKGYPKYDPRLKSDKLMYVRLVRGNESYGQNQLINNGDGSVSDLSTGLMWQISDDGITRDWEEALEYAESLKLAGHEDWRLPNIKELQSIVDYTKSVETSGSPAIDGMFTLTQIMDPEGQKNYGYYWSSTTHQDGMNTASSASYVAFGKAQGMMRGELLDVHGAGAVRSDPKSGNASDYPSYLGPQGDLRYLYNYVIAVRDID
ncbi:DUF1566 domain-containing protein [Acidaminobacter sp. JC074]|uniref:Lcl domain-containing protein n=1 Tax=Acidaminobacter sp. JC074 TaxID=2530199 RepID=UPI001F0EC70E|nr:DUF1566 domain-containing protein [Acidaminobacter sp. JC074]